MVKCLNNECPHGNLKYSHSSFTLKGNSTMFKSSLFFTFACTEWKFNIAPLLSLLKRYIFFFILFYTPTILQFPNSPLLQFSLSYPTLSPPFSSPSRWGKISLQNQQSFAYQVEVATNSSPLHQD